MNKDNFIHDPKAKQFRSFSKPRRAETKESSRVSESVSVNPSVPPLKVEPVPRQRASVKRKVPAKRKFLLFLSFFVVVMVWFFMARSMLLKVIHAEEGLLHEEGSPEVPLYDPRIPDSR